MAGVDPSESRHEARHKGRPKLQEVAEIDRAIREAAVNTLLEQGEAATLNAVAQAAGLSRKSVYARYSNKSELFLGVIRDLLARAQGVEYDTNGTAEQRLYNFICAALELIATPQSRIIQRLLSVDPTYISALRSEMFNASYRHFFVPLHDLLQEAHDKRELIVEDVDATTKTLIKLIFAESYWADEDGAFWTSSGSRNDHAALITNLVTQGMLPRGGGGACV